jgi:hypothetical protein
MKIKTVTSHRHDMKITIRVADAYELAKRFESAPRAALAEVVEQARAGLEDTLERIMRADLELFLGDPAEQTNKRNGFRQRSFTVKGLGSLTLRVPRDRAGRFETKVIPAHRHFDEAIERDLAVLHLAGISTRMLSQLSAPLLGVRVSAMEVSNSLARIVPAAKAFLTRNLAEGLAGNRRERPKAKRPSRNLPSLLVRSASPGLRCSASCVESPRIRPHASAGSRFVEQLGPVSFGPLGRASEEYAV